MGQNVETLALKRVLKMRLATQRWSDCATQSQRCRIRV